MRCIDSHCCSLCFALHCRAKSCIDLHCFAWSTDLHGFALVCIVLHCFALLHIALHCFALLCIASHCFAMLPLLTFAGRWHPTPTVSRVLSWRCVADGPHCVTRSLKLRQECGATRRDTGRADDDRVTRSAMPATRGIALHCFACFAWIYMDLHCVASLCLAVGFALVSFALHCCATS